MKRWALLLVSMLALFWSIREAAAQGVLNFRCNISGFVGATAIHGAGSLQLVHESLHYDLFIPLRSDLPEMAHFHGPPVGSVTPIIPLAPFTKTSGGIRYTGVLDVPSENLPDLLGGRWYVNLHSTKYQGGVLTGFIVPLSVPEPGMLPIATLGGALIFGSRALIRRRETS